MIDDFQNIGDFEEVGFEEYEDRHPFDPVSTTIEQGFQDLDGLSPEEIRTIMEPDRDRNRDMSRGEAIMHCPICALEITNLSERDANADVNSCIDGRPVPLPVSKPGIQAPVVSPLFSKGPTHISKIPETPSAFSKISRKHRVTGMGVCCEVRNGAARETGRTKNYAHFIRSYLEGQ